MRGTWQTSGGPDLSGLIGVVILVIIAAVVAEFVAAYIWWIVGIVAVVIVLAAAGGITYLVHRARQDRPGRPITGRAVYQLPPNRARNWRVPTSRPSSQAARFTFTSTG